MESFQCSIWGKETIWDSAKFEDNTLPPEAKIDAIERTSNQLVFHFTCQLYYATSQ
jgi:hypothetical protein